MLNSFLKISTKKLEKALNLGEKILSFIGDRNDEIKTATKFALNTIKTVFNDMKYDDFRHKIKRIKDWYHWTNSLSEIYFKLGYYNLYCQDKLTYEEYGIIKEFQSMLRFSFSFYQDIKVIEEDGANGTLLFNFYNNINECKKEFKKLLEKYPNDYEELFKIYVKIDECVNLAFTMYDVISFPEKAIIPTIKYIFKTLDGLYGKINKLKLFEHEYPNSPDISKCISSTYYFIVND